MVVISNHNMVTMTAGTPVVAVRAMIVMATIDIAVVIILLAQMQVVTESPGNDDSTRTLRSHDSAICWPLELLHPPESYKNV